MEIIKNIEIYNIIIYFIIYSFIGWVIESTFKSLLFKKPINSGFLHGPFIPIYGVGAFVIVTFLSPFTNNIILLFFLGMIFLTIMEYIIGMVMEKMFNTSWWDYSDNPLNLNGKICLENSIYWGLLTVFLVKILHPAIMNCVTYIPNRYGTIAIIVFLVYFILDYMITTVEVLNLQERVKSFLYNKNFNKFKQPGELKEDLSELTEKILKRSKRLLRIYPKLTYLKINRRLRDIITEIKR